MFPNTTAAILMLMETGALHPSYTQQTLQNNDQLIWKRI